MASNKKYTINQRTLLYEVKKRSRASRLFKPLAFFAVSIIMAVAYFWIYTSVLGLELPKTALLKKKNAEWCSKVEVMNRQLDGYEEALSSLQMRDDDIYRAIFGMNEIPAEVRNAGFGGVNRYAHLDGVDHDIPELLEGDVAVADAQDQGVDHGNGGAFGGGEDAAHDAADDHDDQGQGGQGGQRGAAQIAPVKLAGGALISLSGGQNNSHDTAADSPQNTGDITTQEQSGHGSAAGCQRIGNQRVGGRNQQT